MDIANFKAQLVGGGARPNQFKVLLTFPSFVGQGALLSNKAQFLCKSASLPPSIVENTTVNYRGRAVHFGGERQFTPWAITIYNDVDFSVRNAFESWSNGINSMRDNTGRTNPRDYQVDMEVFQLDRNGAEIKSYKFVDAWPTNVGAIQLDYDANNQIETFDVEFTYNYWESASTTGGIGISVGVQTPIGSFPI